MAVVPKKKYNDYYYPAVYGVNTDEGQDRGFCQYREDDSADGIHYNFEMATPHKFILDGTGTDYQDIRTYKTQELLELANGVKYKLEYAIYNHGDQWELYIGSMYIEAKDGTKIYDYSPGAGNDYIAIAKSDISPDLDNVTVAWYSSKVGYGRDPHLNEYGGITIGGSFVVQKPNPDQYLLIPPPDIDIKSDVFESCYTNTDFPPYVHNEEQLEDVLTRLQEGGDDTPILPIDPEDDISKPDPNPDPDYDPTSDPIPIPTPPIGGTALDSGFIRVYAPSSVQLRLLASKLWDSSPLDSFVDTITKIMNDPMEAIISLHSVPFQITASSDTCRIGNWNSNITMPAITQQFYNRHLGTLHIPTHWASALDYAPYTTIDIYLPFLGVRSMQVDDVVGKTLAVNYMVDIIGGGTVISISCGNSVLYTYNTTLETMLPIAQSSYGPLYNNIVGAIGNVAGGFGAAGAPGAATAAVGSAINVALAKACQVSRGGSIGGNVGALGIFTPYLIIHRPKQSLAAGFAHFKGYPSNITTQLNSISGYTEIESIHLEGIKCTESERDEIRAMLYNGVIF